MRKSRMITPASNASGNSDQQFGEEYYRSHLGPEPYGRDNPGLMNFFATVADQVIRSLQPRTILDAGCAMGLLVEAFWDRGITATGFDISDYAIANVRRDIQPYCRVASVVQPIEGTYDVVTCIEVLEHLPEADAIAGITNIARATNTILFSSSPIDVTEPTHINVRQPIWWLEEFRKVGFGPDLVFDAGFISPHAMLLRKRAEPFPWDVLRLFSEMLRYKHAVTARDAQIDTQSERIRTLQNDVAAVRAASSDLVSRLEAATQVVTRQVEHLSMQVESESVRLAGVEKVSADNAQGIGTIAGNIQDLSRKIERTENDIRLRAEYRSNDINDLKNKTGWLLQETDRAAAVRQQFLDDIAIHAGTLRAEIAPTRSAVLQQGQRLDHLEKSMASFSAQLHDVVHSRIWQTLVRTGGAVLKLSGRKTESS
jgi:hypothetical protein